MNRLPVDVVVLISAAVLAFLLGTFSFSPGTIPKIIAGFILIALIVLKFWWNRQLDVNFGKPQIRGIVLFLVSLVIQLLVLGTGGFYSPLLVLVHLTTIGLGLVVGMTTSIVFWSTNLVILVLNVILDPRVNSAFLADPWTTVLYFFSLILIIPLIQVLIAKYHLKDKLNEALHGYLVERQVREEAILGGIKEMVIVLNSKMQILSVNESFRQALNKDNNEIIFRSFFEVIKVFDRTGEPTTKETLMIDEVISENSLRFFDGYFVDLGSDQNLNKIDLQIKSIQNLDSQTDLIVAIINQANEDDGNEKHFYDLQRMLAKHDRLVRHLKKDLHRRGQDNLIEQMDILNETEQDLLTALELKEHSIDQKLSFQDLAEVCEHEVKTGQAFAESLGIKLHFDYEKSISERLEMIRPKHQLTLDPLTKGQRYTAMVDSLWFGLMLQKLIDLSILLASEQGGGEVGLRLERKKDGLFVELSAPINKKVIGHLGDLFTKGYGQLSDQGHLRFGSGLEGFIAKTVSLQLGIDLEADFITHPRQLVFRIVVTRGVRK